MGKHWKQTATECAVVGCHRTRLKGWSTCGLFGPVDHYTLGKSLYGAGKIEPIDPPEQLELADPNIMAMDLER
jgi:hypothetical protein